MNENLSENLLSPSAGNDAYSNIAGRNLLVFRGFQGEGCSAGRISRSAASRPLTCQGCELTITSGC